MREDTSLFKYQLSIVAILKNEAPYIVEWIDYHLLAGVEHFYLYDNESTDNLKEVLQPYIDKEIVTYNTIAGRCSQMPTYNDAVKRYRFETRYMAFIDADEFILPRGDRSIQDVLSEILTDDRPRAAALGVNWHIFGSSGEVKADLKRSVLDRFKHRAPDDFTINKLVGIDYINTIADPRGIDFFQNPHHANLFLGLQMINEDGEEITTSCNKSDRHDKIIKINANGTPLVLSDVNPIRSDKIVINHYCVKSMEEFITKNYIQSMEEFIVAERNRGFGEVMTMYTMEDFERFDRNEVFDDDIIKYRAAREATEIEPTTKRNARVLNAIIENLSPAMNNADESFYNDRLIMFLTCRAVARMMHEDARLISATESQMLENLSLECLKRCLLTKTPKFPWQLHLLIDEMPEILSRPYPVVASLKTFFKRTLLPQFIFENRMTYDKLNWARYKYFDYALQLSNLI